MARKTKVQQSETDIVGLADIHDVSFVSSGIPEIDELTGGFPKGRVSEIYGAEGVGKSTIVSLCAATLSKTGRVLYIDAEQSLNKDRITQLGGNVDNISYTRVYELERVSEVVLNSVFEYQAIFIDSIAVLAPKSILEGNLGDANIGLYSRLMAKWMKKLKPAAYASGCAIICVNQFRQSPNLYTPRYVPGGTAYQYALDLRLELSTKAADSIIDGAKTKGGLQIGHWITITVKKSRVSTPFKTTRFKFIYQPKEPVDKS